MTETPGVWPVVLTPFTETDEVDYAALAGYVDWLIDHGADGLFAVALSGEMYHLDPAERVEVARCVARRAAGRVPVAASVVGGEGVGEIVAEANDLVAAGVDIVVLVASAVLAPHDDEERIVALAQALAADLPDVALGIYECPIPYHRVLSEGVVAALARTERFVFFKETSHDVSRMATRVADAEGTPLKVFNAGIENYAESLQVGVAGLSGWVVNVAPDLVARLGELAAAEGVTPRVHGLQQLLADIEQRMGPTYPGSAKALVGRRTGLGWSSRSRWREADVDDALVRELADTIAREVAR
ncbi:dihydrodipicolinate synthase family protein [Microbacterium trichothecenolyticum]|uniref:Dihydrodipicolinate synthase family protein n=1 Tax=Microbacterium ureisolvens TaxID=2781186 RepID=A0ABS7I2L8_9MICO|nr:MULTISPECIES: dihydrodipicolinate synthase family protein [Microbacterium]MBW9111909.1 dihydrodipicolinate synthase family protein [Microbacterium ureisolvens]MBW9122244.1 dihydrodipicolinate synthase family protein [Microbacterium trichothecenolyticum]